MCVPTLAFPRINNNPIYFLFVYLFVLFNCNTRNNEAKNNYHTYNGSACILLLLLHVYTATTMADLYKIASCFNHRGVVYVTTSNKIKTLWTASFMIQHHEKNWQLIVSSLYSVWILQSNNAKHGPPCYLNWRFIDQSVMLIVYSRLNQQTLKVPWGIFLFYYLPLQFL